MLSCKGELGNSFADPRGCGGSDVDRATATALLKDELIAGDLPHAAASARHG